MKQISRVLFLLLLVNFSSAHGQNYTKITYVHSDADGTPFAATDEQGDIEWQIDHYPYGDEYSNTEVVRKSDIGFAGKPYDKEIGLSYFGGRWYDPATGRFTSIDPAPIDPNDFRTFNRYAYGFNNPYKYVDPDGYFPIDYAVDGISIAVSAGLYANDPSLSNGLGLIGDVVLGVLPYVPAGIGILRAGDKAVDGARGADALQGAKSIGEQAKELKALNNNKNTVTVQSPNQQTHFDLDGASHKGVETPHKQFSNANTNPRGEKFFNKDRKTVQPMNQQDVRTVRKVLQKRKDD